jgi:hypothetical protein
MARFPDPHARLGCALTDLSGGEIVESRQSPWASATFTGARHQFILHLASATPTDVLCALDEQEFNLPGHVLADIVMSDFNMQGDRNRVTIDALTVEDL